MDNTDRIEIFINDINKYNPKFKNRIALNQSETAEILGVSPGTLENWRREGIGIEYIKTSNSKKSRVLYPKIAIAEYLTRTIKVYS